MSIICKLCNTEFKKIIPWQHLKKHDMDSATYKSQYGSLYSPETLALLAERVPHNKGKHITDPASLAKHRLSIACREQKYKSGELIRKGTPKTEKQKEILSIRQTEYSKNNPGKMSARAKAAIITKQKNGPLSSGMLGKHHSIDTIKKIIQKSHAAADAMKLQRLNEHKNMLERENINLYAHSNYQLYFCRCMICNFEFTRTPQRLREKLFRTDFCPNCREPILKSTAELDILSYVRSLGITAYSGNRSVISPLELDIWIPSHNLAIEYCGLYWHSEAANGKGKEYHKHKFNLCHGKGIQLITIFEDEWLSKPEIVKAMLQNRLNLITEKISARKCQIKEIETSLAKEFLDINHIHGYAKCNVKLGLFFNDKLVYVMTFSKNNVSRKNKNCWEIQRQAGLIKSLIRGGASKLFTYFVNTCQPTEVISYADLRWFSGDNYQNNGFTFACNTQAGYWYFLPPNLHRIHRYSLRKTKNDNPDLTEWENRQKQGYDRIWDCGHAKWCWIKNTGDIKAGL